MEHLEEVVCPICGGPSPWRCWFSKEGKGCNHPMTVTVHPGSGYTNPGSSTVTVPQNS